MEKEDVERFLAKLKREETESDPGDWRDNTRRRARHQSIDALALYLQAMDHQ